MDDTQQTSKPIFAAAITQIIFSLILIPIGMYYVIFFLPSIISPEVRVLIRPILILLLLFPVMGLVGLYFANLWLKWRHNPREHKTNLILTGIFALIFTGLVAGLMILEIVSSLKLEDRSDDSTNNP